MVGGINNPVTRKVFNMSNRVNRSEPLAVAIFTPEELAPLIKALPDSKPATKRLVEFLSTNPNAPTASVCKAVAVSNISQEANSANKRLFSEGVMVGCCKPVIPLRNRFDQETAQHLWGLYKLPKEAANDSEY
jgi:hypothetical protein